MFLCLVFRTQYDIIKNTILAPPQLLDALASFASESNVSRLLLCCLQPRIDVASFDFIIENIVM